jgi:hypothetical protein
MYYTIRCLRLVVLLDREGQGVTVTLRQPVGDHLGALGPEWVDPR